MTRKRKTLDAVDCTLLKLLQEDADRPAATLGRLLGISASSVQRRISALKRSGVIERFAAVVAPDQVDRRLLFLIDVSCDREDVATVTRFKRRMLAAPEVLQCYHVTGEHTFVLLVSLASMEAFTRFAEDLCADGGGVRKIVTSAVMGQVKAPVVVPVEPN